MNSKTSPRVVGTAGHVDHGKSTLVQRLTGIDPDRLREEKARAMTIDLGFAWLTLPDGTPVGLVDVPGHRDFIANMLAGVGGIDAALLVVAADEGIMPQTREHIAILDLLDVQAALVALTKCDLVDDPDWLSLVEHDIHEALAHTRLANAPVVPVSAVTGVGVDTLIDELSALLAALPARGEQGMPRLPVDRVFSLSGFGTIVTGTLSGGSLRVGDTVEFQPSGLRARIRGLQSYEQAVTLALPGSRVAVNVSGVERRDIHRGDVLALPGQLAPTQLVDVRLRLLPDADRPLKHNASLKIYSGAAAANARARLLSHEVLTPGEDGWVQLALETPLALSPGDRFIARVPSPAQTIGGGVIVDAHPTRRHKRLRADVLASLELQLTGSPAQRLASLAGPEPLKRTQLAGAANLTTDAFDAAVSSALADGLMVAPADGLLIGTHFWQSWLRKLETALAAFHEAEPLRRGMSRESLRSQLGVKQATLSLLLDAHPHIVQDGSLVWLADHTIRFTGEAAERVARLRARLAETPTTPPSWSEATALAGEDIVRALVELGEIVHLGGELIFAREAYETLVATTLMLIDRDGSVSANTLRDHVGSSRKYIIGLLEHLDNLGTTLRSGDVRVRGPNAPTSDSASD